MDWRQRRQRRCLCRLFDPPCDHSAADFSHVWAKKENPTQSKPLVHALLFSTSNNNSQEDGAPYLYACGVAPLLYFKGEDNETFHPGTRDMPPYLSSLMSAQQRQRSPSSILGERFDTLSSEWSHVCGTARRGGGGWQQSLKSKLERAYVFHLLPRQPEASERALITATTSASLGALCTYMLIITFNKSQHPNCH